MADLAELAIRFALGGAIVSVFSALGELFTPKTFGGIFGAAPSVAIATLALAFAKEPAPDIAARAAWFAASCAAMIAYCTACVILTKREDLPVWLGAALAWVAWLATAVLSWLALRGSLPS